MLRVALKAGSLGCDKRTGRIGRHTMPGRVLTVSRHSTDNRFATEACLEQAATNPRGGSYFLCGTPSESSGFDFSQVWNRSQGGSKKWVSLDPLPKIAENASRQSG